MYGCESWTILWRKLSNEERCFWTVVLEKTLESPLDCKEIQPVHPKGNHSWIFIGRTDAETPILWPPDEALTYWQRPWCWERMKMGEGDDRGWDGWMASLTWWTWVWVSFRSWWLSWEAWRATVHGGHKESDTTEWLNWLRISNRLTH